MLKPTVDCNSLRIEDKGKEVVLAGWVAGWRDHGGVVFIDLRDFRGKTQIVFGRDKSSLPPEKEKELLKAAHRLRSEYVVAVKGVVDARPEGTENKNLDTGSVEVSVNELEVLNTAQELPFDLKKSDEVGEDTRLKYRYLEMREGKLKRNLAFKHEFFQITRNFFAGRNFYEVETPFLTRSTPEGARDFLVPARMKPGSFYALPQSPQLFKQLLMVGGLGRYFQFVRCFRDEDLRQDRQPEFTQLDLEMSFVDRDDVKRELEEYFKILFKKLLGKDIETPFKSLSYKEAMDKYGTDKPDLRIKGEIKDISDIAGNSSFNVFSKAAANGVVRGIKISSADNISLSVINKTTEELRPLGAKGLAWMRHGDEGLHSQITKFFSKEELEKISEIFKTENGDIVFFIADSYDIACRCLNYVRRKFAEAAAGGEEFCPLWIEDYPLFEKDDEGNPSPMHHPFTAPLCSDEDLIDKSPFKVKSKAYDLVLNGSEIGGGSIRIHRNALQKKVLDLLGMSEKEANDKFGFLLKALSLGAPPHGGFAFGVDRFIACMLGIDSIRDVIPFPKTQKAYSPLTEAPATVDLQQLDELGIEVKDY
ncbi:MAG: aspartate--tRNA ligase [Elusimicrobiota bacterium]